MTKMKSLGEYEEIALEKYGVDSHAVKWIRAQQSNKGKISMSDESMLALLERMHEKTAHKNEAAEKNTAQLPDSEPEIRKTKTNSQASSMFANLKRNRKT